VPKFRWATPHNSQVIRAHLLQFKPIFDPPLKKAVRGAAVPGGGYASKTWSFSSACKNLGAQHPLGAKICSSENCALRGYDFTSKSPRSLDQTSPYLFHLTQEESPYREWLSDFEYLHPFRRYSPPNLEVVRNQAKFCMFFAPEIFLGRAPKILDRHYKTGPSTDHRAKFHAGRPMHLRDLARKEKTSCVKHKYFRKLDTSKRKNLILWNEYPMKSTPFKAANTPKFTGWNKHITIRLRNIIVLLSPARHKEEENRLVTFLFYKNIENNRLLLINFPYHIYLTAYSSVSDQPTWFSSSLIFLEMDVRSCSQPTRRVCSRSTNHQMHSVSLRQQHAHKLTSDT